jgi:hypothetical protein
MNITFDAYNCCSVFTVGSLTTTIESITATNLVIGGVPVTVFGGTADFTAPGFDRTMGTFGFSTQGNGPVTFSATGAANSPVPESSQGVTGGPTVTRLRRLQQRDRSWRDTPTQNRNCSRSVTKPITTTAVIEGVKAGT